ncbi:MAG: cytochrome P450 [Proteobacteria bacterium]|nr:MAG: cytochrome P450 [Pseudomonadota bacterium]
MDTISAFTPPYPKRHTSDLGGLATLLSARRDLLSFWSENSFRYQFMARKILNRHIFIANTPELVKYVFVTQKDNYESKSPQMRKALEPLLGDGLFISDGEVWKKRRLLQNGLFDNHHVAAYSRIMTETAAEMAEQWRQLPNEATVSVLSAMGQLTSEIIARALFGTNLGQENATAVIGAFAEYQAAIEQVHVSNFLGLPDWLPIGSLKMGIAHKAARRIHQLVDEVIAQGEKSAYEHTLLSELLRANAHSKGEAISREGIRNELIVLFMAGHETTANALSWVWYLLSQSPAVENKLHTEIDTVLQGRLPTYADVAHLPYTRAVFEETMRLYPPVPILSRQAKAEDTIRKKVIPPGSIMLVVPWLLHRHRNYWEQPDAFIPERFMEPNKRPDKFLYLPFSVGPRVCIGKMFGLVEAVLAIATLAQSFRLTLPQGTAISHECRLTLRPRGTLNMTLERRLNA